MIHPTAIVDPRAELGRDVSVGAYAVIRADVTLGDGCRVGEHVLVEGPTVLGRDNALHPHSVVGTAPQDLKYKGEPTRLEMGDGNVVREFVTLNRGTVQGEGLTKIGHRCLFMAFTHVAHDCRVGSHVIMANNAALAGHVHMEDFVVVGGMVGIHQFVRIGESAMLAGGSMVGKDVPPFSLVQGDRARIVGVNAVGLKRRGFSEASIAAVHATVRTWIKSRAGFEKTLSQVEAEYGADEKVAQWIRFVRASSDRGVLFKDQS